MELLHAANQKKKHSALSSSPFLWYIEEYFSDKNDLQKIKLSHKYSALVLPRCKQLSVARCFHAKAKPAQVYLSLVGNIVHENICPPDGICSTVKIPVLTINILPDLEQEWFPYKICVLLCCSLPGHWRAKILWLIGFHQGVGGPCA